MVCKIQYLIPLDSLRIRTVQISIRWHRGWYSICFIHKVSWQFDLHTWFPTFDAYQIVLRCQKALGNISKILKIMVFTFNEKYQKCTFISNDNKINYRRKGLVCVVLYPSTTICTWKEMIVPSSKRLAKRRRPSGYLFS